MVKKYDFDAVKTLCAANGKVDRSLDRLQQDLKKLRLQLNECEKLFHGIGTNSNAYKMYDKLYNMLGGTNSYNFWGGFGMWNAVNKVKTTTDQLYVNAVNDKEAYEEEQRRLEEERRRAEEQRRLEEEEQNRIDTYY